MDSMQNDHASLCAGEQPQNLESPAMMTALLALVKQHPNLYDPRDGRHKDLMLTNETWSNIAKELGLPNPHDSGMELCKRKWKNKKDAYLKIFRGQLRGTSVGLSGYRWARHMSFLNDVIRSKHDFDVDAMFEHGAPLNEDDDDELPTLFKNEPAESRIKVTVSDPVERKYTMSNKFTAKLLSLVKQHPYLYDCRDERYKDVQLANDTWCEIAKTLGLKNPHDSGIELCKRKWRNRKDSYLKIFRGQLRGTSVGLSGYRWSRHMSFLNDVIRSKHNLDVDAMFEHEAELNEDGDDELPTLFKSEPAERHNSDVDNMSEHGAALNEEDDDESPTLFKSEPAERHNSDVDVRLEHGAALNEEDDDELPTLFKSEPVESHVTVFVSDPLEPKYTMSNKFSAKLLSLVKQHPYLYDCRDERYKDMQLANDTWCEIAKTLGLKNPHDSGMELCKRKWKNKKDAYLKIFRGQLRGTSVGLSGYRWARHMSFLNDVIRSKHNLDFNPMFEHGAASNEEGDNELFESEPAESRITIPVSYPGEPKYTMSNKFAVKLLSLVKRHPYLYDCREERYKDMQLANNTWCEIAKTLGLKNPHNSGMELCKRKWKNKRDAYLKIFRGQLRGTSVGLCGYRWARHMSFFNDVIRSKHNLDVDPMFEHGAALNEDDEDELPTLFKSEQAESRVTVTLSDRLERKYTMSNKFSAKLLSLVKQHPYLYDCRDERYKDMQLANTTWCEIAKTLGLKNPQDSGMELCKRKWKNKKDAYLKIFRGQLRGTSLGLSGYRWSRHMSFFNDVIRSKHNSDVNPMFEHGAALNEDDGEELSTLFKSKPAQSFKIQYTYQCCLVKKLDDQVERKYTSNKFLAKLLSLVKQHPFLYDCRDERYKDVQLANDTWCEIAKTLDLKNPESSGMTLCRKKWRSKRNTCIRICRSKSWDDLNYYRWARHIGFFKDYLALTRGHVNTFNAAEIGCGVEVDGLYQLPGGDCEMGSQSEFSDTEVNTSAQVSLSTHATDPKFAIEIRPTSQDELPSSHTSSIVDLVNFSGQPVETTVEPVRLQDSNELFLMSCLQPLQQFDEDINAQARIEILQTMQNKMMEQNQRRLQQQQLEQQ